MMKDTEFVCIDDKIESMFGDPNSDFWAKLIVNNFKWGLKGLDVRAAKKAFYADSNAKLFIAVVNNKENGDKKIYYIHKTLSINPTDISDENRNSINKKWETLKESINTLEEDEVISFGKKVYETLRVNKKISNSSDETSGVWIYCMDERISPIWEWLYDEDGKFFWGDKFHIVRIPNGCDMTKECTLDELIILEDKTPPKNKDPIECRITSFTPNLKCLKSCLHTPSLESFQSDVDNDPERFKSCMLYFPMPIFGKLREDVGEIFRNKNNKNLLLYPHPQLTDFKFYPSTWIDSRLEVPKLQTSRFFKYFCDVLDEHLAKPEEANIAKIVTETRKKMCGQELNDQGEYNFWGLLKFLLPAFVGSHLPPAREESNAIGFWRLAYVVNGNPRTTFTI